MKVTSTGLLTDGERHSMKAQEEGRHQLTEYGVSYLQSGLKRIGGLTHV